MKAYYVAFHIPTRTLHYRCRDVDSPMSLLLLLDKWNAQARGTWQFYGACPGYACPRDTARYTEVDNEVFA